MKKLIVALAIVSAVLIVLTALWGELHHVLAAVGLLGGAGASTMIAQAKAAGRAAEDRERKRLEGMTDEEVIDSDPAVKRIADNALAGTRDAIDGAIDDAYNAARERKQE